MTIKLRILPIILLIIFSSIIFAQTDDANDYKNTTSISDTTKRIESLQKFISSHTDTNYLIRAYSDLFNLYAGKGEENLTLEYAEKYLNSYPEETRMNRYNSVAYTLAEKNIGLKSALVYAQKAVELAKDSSPRSFKQILDTQAFVLYKTGNIDSALVLEREAIKGNEDDPSYLYYLSLYEEATGHTMDALMHSAKAVLYGDGVDAISKFNEWIDKAVKTDNEREVLKNKIVNEAIKEYLSMVDDGRKRISYSNAAAFMAKMNSNLKQAETMAFEALSGINEKTPIDELISLKSNLALVYTALGKYDEAITELKTIEIFASPYDSEYWLTLGKSYELSGKVQKSLDAYVNGLIAYAFPNVMGAAETLMKKNNIDPKTLSDRLKLEKENALNFNPGEYNKKNKSGKIVLAELFTGAECPPCVASDLAFDKLSEYYPRTDLAILEYHVHIPGPDPMTNPDTFKRYKFYGGNYGTPTVFFDGQDKMVGGGSNYVAKNRFKVYGNIIDKYLAKFPAFDISGSASISTNNEVTVKLNVSKSSGVSTDKLSLHIALTEKSISYTGSNGINKHIFVVRDLFDGTDGQPLVFDGKTEDFLKSISLNKVVEDIKRYLDNPTTDESWRAGAFTGWRERTDKINSNNLAVVTWIQNNETKEILQSFYTDVKTNLGLK